MIRTRLTSIKTLGSVLPLKLWAACLRNFFVRVEVKCQLNAMEGVTGFGRGVVLWLSDIPLPIIILSALFMRH